jgi:signal peptidase I
MPPPRILLSLRDRIFKSYAGHPFRLFTTALKSLFLYHVIITHFYTIQATMGASMLPTLTAFGDSVLISQHYRRGRDVRVGDVVAFGSVVQDGERVIKRVVGMEGDFVGLGEGGKMLQVCRLALVLRNERMWI